MGKTNKPSLNTYAIYTERLEKNIKKIQSANDQKYPETLKRLIVIRDVYNGINTLNHAMERMGYNNTKNNKKLVDRWKSAYDVGGLNSLQLIEDRERNKTSKKMLKMTEAQTSTTSELKRRPNTEPADQSMPKKKKKKSNTKKL